MSVLGVNFTKVEAERKAAIKGKINISNNILVNSVEKHDLKITNQEALKIEFTFTAEYSPEIGSIVIKGNTVYIESAKNIEAILKQWKKDEKLSEKILSDVMNSLLTKCNIEALIIGREVGLPPTLNMPKVKIDK